MDIENKEEQQVEESGYEDVCFVCHRPESKAGKMIHLTKDICICSECMQKTMDMMSKGNVDYSKMDFSKMPNISMINLSDLQNMIPKRQKVKRKAAEEK
ncbi:MAG: ClpX C4-type zinc finger protein, partial [Lachnospiraceae bacterium]|nr:ClpX C4-type zinc finger protein [Lachnospiraceae bacterium]